MIAVFANIASGFECPAALYTDHSYEGARDRLRENRSETRVAGDTVGLVFFMPSEFHDQVRLPDKGSG